MAGRVTGRPGRSRRSGKISKPLACFGFLAFAATLPFARSPSGERALANVPWEELIREHVARYPAMGPADLYKLLHQATMGSGHAAADRTHAADWLARDLERPSPGVVEPWADTLGRGGRFARIHLRPFTALGGEIDVLLDAFLATARRAPPDREALERALEAAERMDAAGELPWAAGKLSEYLSARRGEGYPAVHHTADYVERYAPAYRVVDVAYVAGLLPG